ncbi:MAG: radical SAM protein [Dehalococcoidales bacterium]|nr:radical SAM protein [Dehalococcoidales bacterium]
MTKSSIKRISFGQFGENLRREHGEHRKPVKGSLELTLRCNLNCVHCYGRLPLQDRQVMNCELSLKEICSLLEEAAEAGCMWLLITGGEPLIRPDFLEIYTYAKLKGFLITLFTNATLLTDELADYLQEYSPYRVEISLYGTTSETHDKVTRVPGSFRRSVEGVHRLLERGIPLNLKTMAMTINRHEIRNLQDFAQSLGVKFRYDPIVNAAFNGSREPVNFRLTPEEVVALDLSDDKRVGAFQEVCQKFGGIPEVDTIFGCGAGLYNFHVDPYGQMSICMTARWPSYDLRHGSLQEGFYSFFPELRSRKPESDYPCGRCELHSLCGNCPGSAYAECGDLEAVVNYYCQIAHQRAKAFGLK